MDIELILKESHPWYAKLIRAEAPLLCSIRDVLLQNNGNEYVSIRDILYNAHLFTSNVLDVVKEWKSIGTPKFILQ